MKIGVTGAAGHLGRLAIDGLLAKLPAEDIIAIVRNPAKAADLAARGVVVRVAAYDDTPALDAALAGVDTLLLISSSEVGRRAQQHRNIIDAAKAAGVRRIVYTSTPQATTTALILAPEHKATEEYLVASGVPYTIVRNNWYTENYVQEVETARKTGAIVTAAGEGRVASATRADYAAGAVAVLLGEGHENKVYEFSGDYAWNFHELAAAISEIIGRPVTYRAVDAAALIELLKGAGLSADTAGFVATLDGNIADGLLGLVSPDLSRLIGRPTTPLLEGLRAALG
ncbi:MAG: Quinone oxidoreductase 2 [Chloroflexi bacterium ADurb.Bin325]|nr:MAG: Quinone oxidoreductase 2 [Chloroflexi bacterium ADurb.Bin325]